MTQHYFHPTADEREDVHFDGTKLIQLPADADSPTPTEWLPMEPGSDAHIALLEQAVIDLQATLAEMKARRDARKR